MVGIMLDVAVQVPLVSPVLLFLQLSFIFISPFTYLRKNSFAEDTKLVPLFSNLHLFEQLLEDSG